ncbi:MAG TPA: right-handed parallel beta-helix repeat-containing protein [Sedimentisphaerales bacterium]|nr:right-handed parallel beta-helix repeat-containing protein [Sedimentisphaerales bacterium]
MKMRSLTPGLLFAALAGLAFAWAAARAETYGGGTGAPNDPFLIYDANQMNAIGANAGDWDKHFKVMADIDLSDYNGLDGNPAFNLIGRYLSPPFTGVFDGNGHAVSNFTLAPTDANDLSGVVALGMFTHVAGDFAEIRDLTLRNVFVDGRALDMPSAALVGRVRGSAFINACRIEGGQIFGGCSAAGLVAISFAGIIYDCHVSCHVEGDSPLNCGPAAGLLVGENDADIYYCTSSGTVVGDRVGGLVGWSGFATIVSCRSDAQVTGIGYASSGGLVGISNADIEDCAATGNVVAARISAGGLVGDNAGTILRSWASGDVVCQDCSGTGGLVGTNILWDDYERKSKVLYSFATGDVAGFFDVGGLVGDNEGIISDSYASGNASGSTRVGGLVGGNWNPSVDGAQYDNGKIYRSYSVGRPSADSRVGGLVGATGENTTVSNCFWDIQTSGMTYSDGGVGKTTAEMKTEATFTGAGWDFNTPVWQICEGVCYPSLWWQYEQQVLGVMPTQLEFAALEGYPSPAGQMLSVGNCGPGTLNWQMDEDCSWLAVEPNSGTVGTFESNDVNVIPATSSLPKGDYYCELIFSDACDPNTIVIVPVDLTVAGPKLSVTPTLVEFTAAPYEPNVGGQIIQIKNTGGGTLNWEITGVNDCNWLSVYPLTGQSRGEVNEVAVTVDPCGLGLGFYNCQLTVSDANAASSPKTVSVSLHVYIPGELHVPVEYSTIQSALNAAVAGETVILQPGSYDEGINIPARDITIKSADPHDPNVVADTILDGAGYRSVVVFSAGAGSPTLTGFTITNGANGIYAEAARPIITRCIIEQNLGHGIRSVDSEPTIVGCSISDNGGAGVSLYSLEQNTALVINCRLLANALDGVSCNDSDLDIINCLIAGNGGNGLWSWSSLLLNISNCSIVENAGTGCDVEESRTKIANSILYDNNLGQIHQTHGLLRVGFSNVEGGWGGTAVIDGEPNFVAPGTWVDVNDPNTTVEPNDPNATWLEGDYRLQPGSPCIDAGDNGDSNTVEPIPFDLDHSARIIDGDCNGTDVVDMGAYEAACACIGDFDGDCDAGLTDFAMLASAWLTAAGQPRYNPACDIALPPDGFIDWRDLKLLAENWLQGL